MGCVSYKGKLVDTVSRPKFSSNHEVELCNVYSLQQDDYTGFCGDGVRLFPTHVTPQNQRLFSDYAFYRKC